MGNRLSELNILRTELVSRAIHADIANSIHARRRRALPRLVFIQERRGPNRFATAN